MGIGDWFVDKIEEVASNFVESVEQKGRNIARVGDAVFGTDDYEDAGAGKRLTGALGIHSMSVDEEKAKKIIEKAQGMIRDTEKCVTKSYQDLTALTESTNCAIEDSHKLKINIIEKINLDYKVSYNNFKLSKKRLEMLAAPKIIDVKCLKSQSEMGVASILTKRCFPQPIDYKAIEDKIKLKQAEEYLEKVEIFAKKIDSKIAVMKKESIKLKQIMVIALDEISFLNSILSDLKEIHPELEKILTKENPSQKESSNGLFLGNALKLFIDMLELEILDSEFNINKNYVNNLTEIKRISTEIKERFEG